MRSYKPRQRPCDPIVRRFLHDPDIPMKPRHLPVDSRQDHDWGVWILRWGRDQGVSASRCASQQLHSHDLKKIEACVWTHKVSHVAYVSGGNVPPKVSNLPPMTSFASYVLLDTSQNYGDWCRLLLLINVKKLQFIHTVNGDGSKTAKIIKMQC